MTRHHLWRSVLCLATLIACASVRAQSPNCPVSADTGGAAFSLEQLQHLEPNCLRSAPYYRAQATAWLAVGLNTPALQALERALLLEPSHPGTLLDYAMVLLAEGDTASAVPLLQELQQRPDLPAYLRPVLAQQLTLLTPPAVLHRLSLSSAVVADSNLNNAPLGQDLTLTLPQGNITLPLAQDYQAQSGTSVLTQAQWTALRPDGPQLWTWQAELRQRQHADRSHRTTRADLSASWLQAPDAPSQWLLRASYSGVVWGGQHLYNGARFAAQYQWTHGAHCRLNLGAELELRQYPQTSVTNGQYQGLLTSWACAQGTRQWQLQARAGQDTPSQANRPGQAFSQQEWRALWQDQWGPGQLLLDYQVALQQDSSGYSPLLASNAVRQQRRHALGLEYTVPFGANKQWQWFMALEASRQHSNIGLFASARQALSAGLRWSSP